MRNVKAIYRAGYTDYDGLATYTVMPTRNVPIEMLEPFIFLNHHGPQNYKPGNNGLPFGPHPHKGFETVTFILDGDIVHADSKGFKSTIYAGGIQWMTAGKGIIHSENSSADFLKSGGTVEVLQLWVNLPAKLKNTPPHYIGLQKDEIPEIFEDDGKVMIHPVSGTWENKKGPINAIADVSLAWIELKKEGRVTFNIDPDRVVLFYVIKGNVVVNNTPAEMHELVEFGNKRSAIEIEATDNAIILIGHAKPNKEPIVAHGPFVMNTQEEIRQAFVEYQQGVYGTM